MRVDQLDVMTRQYAETALWSSTEYDENGNDGESLDANYTLADIHPDTLQSFADDCHSFICYLAGNDHSARAELDTNLSRAGHDFWLTRNHHGAGFWDGDWKHGDTLTKAAHTFGSVDLYVGEDGKIHQG